MKEAAYRSLFEHPPNPHEDAERDEDTCFDPPMDRKIGAFDGDIT